MHYTVPNLVDGFIKFLKYFNAEGDIVLFSASLHCLSCAFSFFCLGVTFLVKRLSVGYGGYIVDLIVVLYNTDTYWNDFVLRWRFDFTYCSYHSLVLFSQL